MVAIANAAIYLTKAKLEIGSDEYTAAISGCVIKPNTPTAVFADIGGGVQAFAGNPDWVLEVDFAQDYVTANSLSQFLLTNVGQSKVFKLTPLTGGTPKVVTISAVCVPSDIGGAARTVAISKVSLPCVGQPVIA